MNFDCVRCEAVRAKLRAIICYNTTRDPDALISDLNRTQKGEYFYVRDWHPEDGHTTTFYRRNNIHGAPNIEIWSWGEAEPRITRAF